MRAPGVVLAAVVLGTGALVLGVHEMQIAERRSLREGVIRDEKMLQLKMAERQEQGSKEQHDVQQLDHGFQRTAAKEARADA